MRWALILISGLIIGCRTWDVNHTVDISPLGQKLCAQHHVPLITVRAYQPPTYPDRVILVHDNTRLYHGIAYQRVANPIGEGVSLRPHGILREPTTIRYCPVCEKEFEDYLRVPDEQAAVKYVRNALPMWSPAKGVVTGPYQISLRGGVWTVKCLTTDGYHLTAKIAKEEGRLLSYDAAK